MPHQDCKPPALLLRCKQRELLAACKEFRDLLRSQNERTEAALRESTSAIELMQEIESLLPMVHTNLLSSVYQAEQELAD